jgi:hypothetical protein
MESAIEPRVSKGHRIAGCAWAGLVVGLCVLVTLLLYSPRGRESSARNRTVAIMGAIRAALERYKELNGDYPKPTNPEETELFDGKHLRTGAAHMLYQAITGDGNAAILVSPRSVRGNHESDGKLDDIETKESLGASVLPKSCVHPANVPVGIAKPRLLVDGWGRPFQYIKADPDPAKNKAINPTYDLWSFGPRVDANAQDVSPAARGDERRTASWIVNWRWSHHTFASRVHSPHPRDPRPKQTELCPISPGHRISLPASQNSS